MHQGKLATKTPAGNYRIPVGKIGAFRFGDSQLFGDLYGDIVDRIGAYEDCKTLSEINAARKRFGLPEIKK